MKTVVFAYHNMGLAGLDALARYGYDIAAVFTHEDDPDENCWFGSVKNWAEQKNITVYTTEEVNSEFFEARIFSLLLISSCNFSFCMCSASFCLSANFCR